MASLEYAVTNWLKEAERNMANGGVTRSDLQQLRQIVRTATLRQRLVYLHTRTPSILAPVIGMAQHEPVAGQADTLHTRKEWPYDTVHEALIDGWQIIQFPNLMAPYDDRELNYVGYEFILQKLEEIVND